MERLIGTKFMAAATENFSRHSSKRPRIVDHEGELGRSRNPVEVVVFRARDLLDRTIDPLRLAAIQKMQRIGK